MYSWDLDTADWRGGKKYAYTDKTAARMTGDVARARSAGPRTYERGRGPNEKVVSAHKRVSTKSTNPIIVAVDVTGSMSTWPREIFDRLPLLYTTLSQYREDAEILFAAIGDGAVDRWPLQVTTFASGFDLEQQLGAIYGEGGGGDAPESYGLFAQWLDTHVTADDAKDPFLIVFGDINMHDKVPASQIRELLGDDIGQDVDAIATWKRVSKKWNTWFLRRPGGRPDDHVAQQWARAIGKDRVFPIDDEQRAVDYAMGIIARAWGCFGDFQENMRARQDDAKVESVSNHIRHHGPKALVCPSCGAPLPASAGHRYTCAFCNTTVVL